MCCAPALGLASDTQERPKTKPLLPPQGFSRSVVKGRLKPDGAGVGGSGGVQKVVGRKIGAAGRTGNTCDDGLPMEERSGEN